MMNAIDCLKTRRSIRSYRPDPVPQNLLDDILDCARLAPSGANRQSWRFVVLRGAGKDALKDALPWVKFLTQAPVAIAVLTGPDALTPVEDASCATTSICHAAHALGLGTCWVNGGHASAAPVIAKAVGAPEGWTVRALVTLGYSDDQPAPNKKALGDVVSYDRF